ncbi:MAG: glucose-6-phosphate isomerase [Halodesulfurarchaeum sp.]
MRVDIGSALATTSPIGVPRAALERLDERVEAAHQRIETGRREGAFGFAALNLPETTDPSQIQAVADQFRDESNLLTVGIGGSALGAATFADALDGDGEVTVLDNIDPAETGPVLTGLPLEDTLVNVVSRSGTTVETLATFLVVREALQEAGLDWTERTVVTTGPDGPLRDLAERHDLPVLDVPEGVPGRFSALSPVGLLAAAFKGRDISAILDGAEQVANSLRGSLFETPAYAYGATMYALERRGAGTNVMLPYAEGLSAFAEWFAQLWAESLGKDGLGQTPVRAMGATDQHSQLQLYRAGPLDKVVTLLRPTERPAVSIPDAEFEGVPPLGEHTLGGVLDAEFDATAASLAEAGVPTVQLSLGALDEAGIGELLYTMEAACILAGELYGVETFTQPAVEWGKEAAAAILSGERPLPESERLVVDG